MRCLPNVKTIYVAINAKVRIYHSVIDLTSYFREEPMGNMADLKKKYKSLKCLIK